MVVFNVDKTLLSAITVFYIFQFFVLNFFWKGLKIFFLFFDGQTKQKTDKTNIGKVKRFKGFSDRRS